MIDEEIKEILGNMNIVEKISDSVRLVDPMMKRTLSIQKNEVKEIGVSCFDFWKRNKACDNCISIRALNDNATYVKLEYSQAKIFLITAIPHDIQDRRVIIELFKDVTDSMSLDLGRNEGSHAAEIYALIDTMNNLALKDPLTGVYNRRYINEKLPVDLVNSALLSQKLSVIMADIDHFKNVNDVYGHVVGDCVIKSVAEKLTGCTKRTSDWVARYGGEEFLICLPGANIVRAKTMAETMRKAIEEKAIDCGGSNVNVTASFGVYCEKATGIDNIETLIQRADEKLYLAKKNGRNRIEY